MSAETFRPVAKGPAAREIALLMAEVRKAEDAARLEGLEQGRAEARALAEVVNEAMELLGLPPGSTDEQFLDAIRTARQQGRDEALPVAAADIEALVVAMLEGMANASMHSVRTEALIGAALAVSLGQHRSAEINEKAIVAAHREAAGFNPSKAGGEARSRALPSARRSEIARKAAHARWEKHSKDKAARARWAAKKGE